MAKRGLYRTEQASVQSSSSIGCVAIQGGVRLCAVCEGATHCCVPGYLQPDNQ